MFIEQTYVVLKPTAENATRDVLTTSGGFGVGGSVDVGICRSLADMPRILAQLQEWSTPPQGLGDPQPTLEPLGEVSELSKDDPFFTPTRSLARNIGTIVSELTGEWVEDAVLTCIRDHEEYKSFNQNSNADAEIDDLDESSFFFKLKPRQFHEDLSHVECMAAKVFAQTVLVTLLYFQDYYYATIYDVVDTEQTLLDSWFPDLSVSLHHTQFERMLQSPVESVELHILPAHVARGAREAIVDRHDEFGSASLHGGGWDGGLDGCLDAGLSHAPTSIFDMNAEVGDEGDLIMDATLLAATEAAMQEMNLVAPKPTKFSSQLLRDSPRSATTTTTTTTSFKPCHRVPPLSNSSSFSSSFGSSLPLPPTPLKWQKAPSNKKAPSATSDISTFGAKQSKPKRGGAGASRKDPVSLSPPSSPPPPLPRYLNR